MKTTFLIITLIFFIAACDTETKIDASSEDSLQNSIAKIMKELAPSEQINFERSLKVIMLEDADNLVELSTLINNTAISKGIFRGKIDGKTADEIIETARKITSDLENEKPVTERAGVPISAKDFLK